MKKNLFSRVAVLLLACVVVSCSQDDVIDQSFNEDAEVNTRAVTDTLTAERVEHFSNWGHIDFYVDAPGNLYSVLDKAYLEMIDLSNVWHEITKGLTDYWMENPLDIGSKPTYGLCVDLNDNIYYIGSNNTLVKVNRVGQRQDLTDKFPENTVFLGIVTAQVNSNVFVATAQGDGSDNPWKNYDKQTLYRIAANGNVTKLAEDVYAPVVSKPYGSSEWRNDIENPNVFTYTSILSKAKGAVAYGMDANGYYYKVNTTTGEVTYYTARQPLQFLTAGTAVVNPIALSGRQILQIRPNLNKDLVIGVLPSSIPEGAEVLNFLTNADATIFYIVILETKTEYNGTLYEEPSVFRLRLNN